VPSIFMTLRSNSVSNAASKSLKKAVTAGILSVIAASACAFFIVYAQSSPASSDANSVEAEMPFIFNIDLRAIVHVRSPVIDEGKIYTDNLDKLSGADIGASSSPPSGMGKAGNGNVGWLFVETNYNAWDILVRRENGGFLMRESRPGDSKIDVLGAYDSINAVQVEKGIWLSNRYDTTRVGGVSGVALRYDDGSGAIRPCPLEIAIGVLDPAALTNDAAMFAAIKDPDNSVLNAPLLFYTGAGPAKVEQAYASFAYSLAKSPSAGVTAKTVYFGPDGGIPWTGSGLSVLGEAAKPNGYFPHIDGDGAPSLGLDVAIGDPYTQPVKPNANDLSIGFYINARLGLNTAKAHLAGNRNGDYQENLIFTFYGLY